MKCTIEKIINVPLSGNRFGSRIEGFIPMAAALAIMPDSIKKWISNYEGIKIVAYEDGLFVASWAETTCSERDNYDSDRGSHIAESKAKAKIYRFIRNLSEKMGNYFASWANTFEDAYLKYDHCVTHEEQHFATLGNENN